MGFLVVMGSFALAVPAFAGISNTMRLNGAFSLQDETAGDNNEACVVAVGPTFLVVGEARGTSGGCGVELFYNASAPTKVSMSTLKSDNKGKGQVQQKVETTIGVDIFDEDDDGPGVCDESGFFNGAPAKCRTTGRVDATEGGESPDTVEKGKVDVSCDLGDGFGQLGALSLAQQDAIVAAFDGRKDVKVSSKGKVKIKVKAVADDGSFCES
jgi:hypothetical protein